ncbi:MAG: hypothetical protein CVU59_04485 [Deltaproteobacteria bacterium HGW-Deltaproteobacteria-17]|nr:MAG: hypothetical protein CVU59_04485 [Deltaproteobacteria bacterium HGW-Deltaproteobacteria-17]
MRFLFTVTLILSFSLSAGAQMAPTRGKTPAKPKAKPKEPWNKTPMLIKDIKRITVPTKGMDRECLARLKAAGIPYQLFDNVAHVTTPIKPLTTKLGGVVYRRAWNNPDAPWILECKTVENLILAGPKLQKWGIASMYWNSAWRVSYVEGKNQLSRHSFGEALDVTAIDGSFGYASLVNHWESGSRSPKARALHGVSAALRDSGLFSSVLTPAYNAAHRDHFHIDSPSRSHKLAVKYDVKSLEAPDKAPTTPDMKPDARRDHELQGPLPRPYEPPRSRPRHY